MSDQDAGSGNEVLDAVIAQNAETDETPPPSAPAEAPETPQETPAWVSRWGTSDPLEALEKATRAHDEATKHISATRRAEDQPAQQPQQQDPLSFLPPQIDEATFKRIEASAERDPQGTALWALENQQQLGPQITNACLRNWADQDFLGYEQWQMQQIYAAQQEAQAQHQAPIEQYTYQQISNAAVAEAGNGIPDFEAYKPLILSAIENNPHISEYVKSVTHDPQQLAKAIEWVYGAVKGSEYVQQVRQAPPGQQQTPAVDSSKTRTRTETRSTTAPPEGKSGDDALSEMILNAKP